MICKIKKYIPLFFVICFGALLSAEYIHKHTDFLLCRLCGFNIAPATHVINIQSPSAEDVSNRTLFGLENVEIQRIQNAVGIEFNIVLTSGGTCIGRREKWKSKYSWYPGYLWKPCYCSHCSTHIGWIFEPIVTAHDDRVYASTKGFYALILDKIISENYSNSLLVSPRISSHREL